MAHQSDLIATDIEKYLKQHEKKSLLRFITCGSVDDGKSTVIGRLLYESKMLFEDQLAAIENDSRKWGTQGGDIDRDALFALGLKAIEQKREVDVLALGAVLDRVAFQGGELVLEQHLRLVQQPADDGRLAVVDGAAGDEAQEFLTLVLSEVLVNVGGDEC